MGHKYYVHLSVPLVKLSNIANKEQFLDAQRRIQGFTRLSSFTCFLFCWLKFLLQNSRVMRRIKVFLISTGIFAFFDRAYAVAFAKSYGGTRYDVGYSVQQTSDG
jgi:hypothetical protein